MPWVSVRLLPATSAAISNESTPERQLDWVSFFVKSSLLQMLEINAPHPCLPPLDEEMPFGVPLTAVPGAPGIPLCQPLFKHRDNEPSLPVLACAGILGEVCKGGCLPALGPRAWLLARVCLFDSTKAFSSFIFFRR